MVQVRATKRPTYRPSVLNGPFEPFTLIHLCSYAGRIQLSGAAIADHLKSWLVTVRFNSVFNESGGIMAVVKSPRCRRTSFEGLIAI
jgi:hypothetical protein